MYAPIFPYYAMKKQLWHKVDPLHLVHPICNRSAVLMTNRVREELPDDAEFCAACKYKLDRFAAARRI